MGRHSRLIPCALSLLLVCLPCLAWAGQPDIDLEAPIQEFLVTSGAPGVSVSVLEKGKSVPLTVSRGSACLGNSVNMDNRTVMRLGSVTKVFTAIRIKMLIEEGQLDNEMPISRFFPDLPHGEEIRIRHLLTHTSGLPEMLRLEPFASDMAHPWSSQELLSMIAAHPLDFAPGTEQRYSNSGYLLLGMIIETVTGEPFAKQIVEKVAAPLGMRRLQAGDDTSIVSDEACGYSSDEGGRLRKPVMASLIPPMATGNLIGTAEDIVRLVNQGQLLKQNLIDTPPSGPLVLDNGSVAQRSVNFEELSFDQSLLAGMTVFRFRDRAMNLIGKDGMFPGFASWFLYDPETRTAVAVVTNLETRCMEAMQLAVRILEERRKLQE